MSRYRVLTPLVVLAVTLSAASAQMSPMADSNKAETAATTATLPPPPRTAVVIDAAGAAAIGLRLEAARQERVTESLRTVAVVVLDETKISHVPSPVSGWIEALHGPAVGQTIRAGDALATVSSPELLAAQTEYLVALREARFGPRGASLESARAGLKELGANEAEITELEQTGEPQGRIEVRASNSGLVLRRTVGVGALVDPSTEIVTLADLASVWVIAEVPESGHPLARLRSNATIDFTSSGRKPFVANIDYVDPTPAERTRTLRVRFSVANADGKLRPGQYGNVDFHGPSHDAVTIPREALIEIGAGQYTWVAVAPDRFEPRSVAPGARIGDRVEIRAGLDAGDRVVAAGVFLLDAESRFQATDAPTD
jgi:Cu(I)/Ag(I) efflux system membrane fusion protein